MYTYVRHTEAAARIVLKVKIEYIHYYTFLKMNKQQLTNLVKFSNHLFYSFSKVRKLYALSRLFTSRRQLSSLIISAEILKYIFH